MKCEHGLTTKECYVCMSPKYGKHDTKQECVAKPQEKRHEKQEPVTWQDTRKTWVDVPIKNVLKEMNK